MLAIAITAIGVAGSLVALYEFAERHPRKRVSWRRVDQLVDRLVDDIESGSFSPELILGVGRGGALIASMLATNLEGRIQLACLDTESNHDGPGRKNAVLRNPELVPSMAGKDVLVVVAELYSGQDLRAAVDFVEAQQPKAFRTLALLCGPASVVRPNFEGMRTEHEPRAPWRITDAGCNPSSRI